jgi:hypothetical protein
MPGSTAARPGTHGVATLCHHWRGLCPYRHTADRTALEPARRPAKEATYVRGGASAGLPSPRISDRIVCDKMWQLPGFGCSCRAIADKPARA